MLIFWRPINNSALHREPAVYELGNRFAHNSLILNLLNGFRKFVQAFKGAKTLSF